MRSVCGILCCSGMTLPAWLWDVSRYVLFFAPLLAKRARCFLRKITARGRIKMAKAPTWRDGCIFVPRTRTYIIRIYFHQPNWTRAEPTSRHACLLID